MHRARFPLVTIVVLLFGLLAGCNRNPSGQILGTVTNEAQVGVPDAIVTVLHQDTNMSIGLKTDRSGKYASPLLPAGKYVVVAEKAGFQADRRFGIIFSNTRDLRIDLRLAAQNVTTQQTSAPTTNQ
jgi:hypothetical protein